MNARRHRLSQEYQGGVHAMHFSYILLQPLIALIAGVIILLVPRILNYVVAIYLIFIGITGLWPHLLH
jgi:mannitol-specific phosphotransferase system IIBC component